MAHSGAARCRRREQQRSEAGGEAKPTGAGARQTWRAGEAALRNENRETGTAPQAMPRRPQPVHGESEGGRMRMHTRGREGESPPSVAGHESRPPEMGAERCGAAPQAKARGPARVRGESEGRRMHMYMKREGTRLQAEASSSPAGADESRQREDCPPW